MTRERIADFWFDPSCPYTWVTSRWLVEVTKVRPVAVRWHVMSLSILNEHRADDPEGDPHGYLRVPARICAAVQHEYGQPDLDRLYTALWSPAHRTADWPSNLRGALEDAGLPRRLARAGSSTDYDAVLRASHTEGISLVGPHVGTPIIATTDEHGRRTAFFGPVLSRIPTGEQAAQLWDGTLLVTRTSGFHELTGPPPHEPELA